MSGTLSISSGTNRSNVPVRSTTSIITGSHVFEIPAKLIKTPADMKIWEKSEAYFEYLGFVLAINDAIKGKSNSQGSENLSESVIKLVGVLDKLDALIDETPPVQQPQRFGNVAFRTWYQKMRDESLILLQEVISAELFKSIPEIVSYLVEGFGNSTRIDYGTGHEISFIMFLCCLFKIGLFTEKDKVATGCYIFPRYLDLARKLQKTYRMEPAGSHGVWSLDDYQFVPFIWGSSQLVAHPAVEPNLFLNQQILNDYGDDYMFLTCIQYINSVKSGPFAEHSNQLWSISGVSSWSKINGGLIKMYKAEVLSKFPVVQHIVFGSLFTLTPMEECTGFMTPKYPPIPPPNAASVSSSSSESIESFAKVDATEGSPKARAHGFRRPAPPDLRRDSITSERSSRSKTSSQKSEESLRDMRETALSLAESEGGISAIRDIEMVRRARLGSEESSEKESVRFHEPAHPGGRRAVRMPMEGFRPGGRD